MFSLKIHLSCAALLAFTLPLSADEAVKGEAGKVIESTYKTTADKKLNVFTHFPEDWKPGDKRPAIVFFFGGGWVNGMPTAFERQATYLARRGMVAVRADYTLKKGPAVCVDDARDAIRWMRKHAKELGIDPDRIASSGGSAGGHLAACLGCCPSPEKEEISSKANAMVLFNPVLDMELLAKNAKKFDLTEEKAATISPQRHYTKADPPAIIFFGTDDFLLNHGKAFMKKAKELGTRAELVLADKQPHSFFHKSPWYERTLLESDKFLVSIGYLKGEPTLKVPKSELPEMTIEKTDGK